MFRVQVLFLLGKLFSLKTLKVQLSPLTLMSPVKIIDFFMGKLLLCQYVYIPYIIPALFRTVYYCGCCSVTIFGERLGEFTFWAGSRFAMAFLSGSVRVMLGPPLDL